MKLTEFFLLEGSEDQAWRARAQAAYNDILDQLVSLRSSTRWKKNVRARLVQDPALSWMFIPQMTDELDGTMSIVFALCTAQAGMPEASFSPAGPSRPGGTIFLHFEVAPEAFERALASPDVAWTKVKQNADRMFESMRSEFIHEYTHFLDRSRQKGKLSGSSAARAKGRTAYYAHPLELNAFMQEMFDSFEQEVERYPVLLGKDTNEFYKNFVDHTKREQPAFYAHIRQRNIPRLKKRVAQLRQDLLAKQV